MHAHFPSSLSIFQTRYYISIFRYIFIFDNSLFMSSAKKNEKPVTEEDLLECGVKKLPASTIIEMIILQSNSDEALLANLYYFVEAVSLWMPDILGMMHFPTFHHLCTFIRLCCCLYRALPCREQKHG